MSERRTLQFRAELFNVLNRANFNAPNAIVFTPTGVSPTAGVITSTSTTSRQAQFGLKLFWCPLEASNQYNAPGHQETAGESPHVHTMHWHME